MAISATTGLVSGTDYASLINSLISAESAAIDPTEERKSEAEALLSAMQNLNLQFSYVTLDMEALLEEDSFEVRTASVGDASVIAATASAGAMVGSYSVRVDSLAQAEQVLGGAVASDATFTGTLTIAVGDGSTWTYDASEATLSGLAAVINTSSTSPVSAQVVDMGDGTSRLMLSADASGAQNTIALGGDLGSAGPFASTAIVTAAQDAQVTLRIGSNNAVEMTRTSTTNSFAGIVTGVDLALKSVSEGFTSLSIAVDSDAVANRVEMFVTDLNSALSTYATNAGYNSSTSTAGLFFSNGPLRVQIASLHTALATIAADGSSLADLGISYDSTTGQYDLDAEALSSLLASDPSAASRLFIDSGIGSAFKSALDGLTDSYTGTLAVEEDSLTERIAMYDEQIESFNTALEGRRERYQAQFLALEQTLAKLESQKSALTSFIDGLNKSDD